MNSLSDLLVVYIPVAIGLFYALLIIMKRRDFKMNTIIITSLLYVVIALALLVFIAISGGFDGAINIDDLVLNLF